jgi:hypothetical protein
MGSHKFLAFRCGAPARCVERLARQSLPATRQIKAERTHQAAGRCFMNSEGTDRGTRPLISLDVRGPTAHHLARDWLP